MIRAIRPAAMAQDDAAMVAGWNISPNHAYTLLLTPGASACGVLLFDAEMTTLIASGAALVGTAQPCVLVPQSGAVGMVDADLGWHLLVTTTGTESQRTIRIGPAVDLPDEIHPIYAEDDLAVVRARSVIDDAAHYIDDLSVSCPLGLGAGLGDVASVPVDGAAVVGQVENITWTGTPNGAAEVAVIRRHVAIAPESHVDPVPITPPTVADDEAETNAKTAVSGNVLTNDETGLAIVAVNGLSANIGASVTGSNGGVFTISSAGVWTFDPAGDFDLLDGAETAETSVTYHASDGVGEAGATLTVTVNAVADPLWTPSQITGAQQFDASGSHVSFGTIPYVSSVADTLGGSNTLAQPIGTKQPQLISNQYNTLPTLRFDGNDDFVDLSTAIPAGYNIFMVRKTITYDGTYGVVIGKTDSNAGMNSNGSGDYLYGVSFSNVFKNGAVSSVTTWPTVNTKHFVNLTLFSFTANQTLRRIGAREDGSQANHGDVCEIIITPSLLDATARQKLEGYLAHKWGLAANLPSGHPYKSSPPTL